jgi:hypothetical protein
MTRPARSARSTRPTCASTVVAWRPTGRSPAWTRRGSPHPAGQLTVTLAAGEAVAVTPRFGEVQASAGVGGVVAPTLSLSLAGPASLGTFVPGADRSYETEIAATLTSTAASATLSAADPGATAPGRLINGALALNEPLQARAGDAAFAPLSGSPLALQAYPGPVSDTAVTIGLRQHITADEPLRTGTYAKTLTFTLATSAP